MTTQEILLRPPAAALPPPLTPAERSARVAALQARAVRTEVQRAAQLTTPPPAAVQPRTDPDATVVIGRHRQDGTTTLTAPRRLRGRFVGRVAASVVAAVRGLRR